VWITSSFDYDLPNGRQYKLFNFFLQDTSASADAANSNFFHYAMQPGVFKLLSMHNGTNGATRITNAYFAKRKWNAGAEDWDSATRTLLFTIPIGAVGYHCSSPSSSDLAARTFETRDLVAIELDKTATSTNGPRDNTLGIVVEFSEEDRT